MIPLSIYKIGVPVGLFAYYVFRLFRIYILKSNMELKFPTLYTLFLGLGIPASLFLIVQTFFIPDLVDYLSLLYVNVICTHFPGHILFTSLNTWVLPCILQGASILFFSGFFYCCSS